jgi:hypothetical protein
MVDNHHMVTPYAPFLRHPSILSFIHSFAYSSSILITFKSNQSNHMVCLVAFHHHPLGPVNSHSSYYVIQQMLQLPLLHRAPFSFTSSISSFPSHVVSRTCHSFISLSYRRPSMSLCNDHQH